MARRVSLFASKFFNVVILIYASLFALNFCSTMMEENKFMEESINSHNSDSNLNEVALQDKNCVQFFYLNISFAVVLAMLWNAKQAIKIGTI
jgi:hypothetical protein